MGNTPPPHGQLAQHLADRTLTPIISSATTLPSRSTDYSSQSQLEALTSLTSSAIAAFEAASRLGLGIPQRIMVETSPGPILLHSFLSPQSRSRLAQNDNTDERGIVEQAREELRSISATTEDDLSADEGGEEPASINGARNGEDANEDRNAQDGGNGDDEEEDTTQRPPLLIATVVAASVTELGDARRAAAQLERTGREIQREWLKEQQRIPDSVGHGGDG